jgi:hypothetical protein
VRKSLIYLHTAVGHNNIQHAVRYAACDRAVPELLEGLRVAARLLAILVVGGRSLAALPVAGWKILCRRGLTRHLAKQCLNISAEKRANPMLSLKN